MKKIYYLAAALTVLAGAASCEKDTETTQPQPCGELRQVTIAAGSTLTRTSVSAGALTWSENDKLNIVPQSGTVAAAVLSIKTGVGETSGTFEGQIAASIMDDTDLYGWCGGAWTYNEGSFSVDMPAAQTYAPNGLAENAYPSIGTGSITDGITLNNPMGVLKLTVKGAASDLVKRISVTSSANNLAGAFAVDPSSSYAVSGGSSKTLTLNVASPVALSSDGVNFYVVVPPAEYAANDLTVTVTKSDDSSFSNTFADAVTVTANNATVKEVKDLPKYICFEALEADSEVAFDSFPSDMKYSTNGTDWYDFTQKVTMTGVGDKCYVRTNVTRSSIKIVYIPGVLELPCKFTCTGNLKISGNIMALLNSENPSTTMVADNAGCFQQLFQSCTALTDASELSLPATTLAENCYASMFSGCTNLTKAPSISATTLASGCCDNMFNNCEKLTEAPALYATDLPAKCYYYMFSGCTSLETAPAMSATTLGSESCKGMFNGCSKLSSAPQMTVTSVADYCCVDMFCGCSNLEDASSISLTAATLAANCYYTMFCNCSELKKAPKLSANTAAYQSCEQMFEACSKLDDVSNITFATTVAEECYKSMFYGCESLESVPKLPAETLVAYCYHQMFSGCTKLSSAPDMSDITTLASSCCESMFSGCTSLETAPVLNAVTLVESCYSSMFKECTSLTTAPALPATTLADHCYDAMFCGCSNLTSAPVLEAETLKPYCYYTIFSDCRKLSSVTMMAKYGIDAENCLNSWLNAHTGDDSSVTSRTVYVASGMVDAVKATVPGPTGTTSSPDWQSGVQVKP